MCMHLIMKCKLGFISHNILCINHSRHAINSHFYFDIISPKSETQNESISSMTTITTDEMETKNQGETTHF